MKKYLRFSFVLFICLIIAFTITGCKKDSKPKETEKISYSDAEETTVYITKSGTKYHTKDCYCLKKSKIKKTLADISDDYEPCSICCPPIIE